MAYHEHVRETVDVGSCETAFSNIPLCLKVKNNTTEQAVRETVS